MDRGKNAGFAMFFKDQQMGLVPGHQKLSPSRYRSAKDAYVVLIGQMDFQFDGFHEHCAFAQAINQRAGDMLRNSPF